MTTLCINHIKYPKLLICGKQLSGHKNDANILEKKLIEMLSWENYNTQPKTNGPCYTKTCFRENVDSEGASAQSDQRLNCPLRKSMNKQECMNREQRPGLYLAHAQGGLNLRILCMVEDTVSLEEAQNNKERCANTFNHSNIV